MKFDRATKRLVYGKYGGKCAYCGLNISQESMSIDHFYPKSKGGSDDISNLIPSCSACNTAKGSHSIYQFRHQLLKLSKKIEKQFNTALAIQHGILEFKQFTGFYFEKNVDEYGELIELKPLNESNNGDNLLGE